jgi:hypothetical protein
MMQINFINLNRIAIVLCPDVASILKKEIFGREKGAKSYIRKLFPIYFISVAQALSYYMHAKPYKVVFTQIRPCSRNKNYKYDPVVLKNN